jgi:hypothetical protein
MADNERPNVRCICALLRSEGRAVSQTGSGATDWTVVPSTRPSRPVLHGVSHPGPARRVHRNLSSANGLPATPSPDARIRKHAPEVPLRFRTLIIATTSPRAKASRHWDSHRKVIRGSGYHLDGSARDATGTKSVPGMYEKTRCGRGVGIVATPNATLEPAGRRAVGVLADADPQGAWAHAARGRVLPASGSFRLRPRCVHVTRLTGAVRAAWRSPAIGNGPVTARRFGIPTRIVGTLRSRSRCASHRACGAAGAAPRMAGSVEHHPRLGSAQPTARRSRTRRTMRIDSLARARAGPPPRFTQVA